MNDLISNKYIKNKDSHELNIIPEGKETNEFYVDGFKTANSEEQQLKTLRGIKGMENIDKKVVTQSGELCENDKMYIGLLHFSLILIR